MFKVLASRITIFTLTCIWILGWIAVNLVGFDAFNSILHQYEPSWVTGFLLVWYVITVILIGVWAAIKGFRFVGRWVREDKDESSSE